MNTYREFNTISAIKKATETVKKRFPQYLLNVEHIEKGESVTVVRININLLKEFGHNEPFISYNYFIFCDGECIYSDSNITTKQDAEKTTFDQIFLNGLNKLKFILSEVEKSDL